MTNVDPFTTMLDLRTGRLDPELEVTERRFSDMPGIYLEDEEVDVGGDPIIYRVYDIPVPATTGNVLASTTVIEPGTVSREYFMTKGHFHELRDRAEIYIGLAGEGRLLMATEDGEHVLEPMRRGTVNYVPGGWAHRSINVGEEPLVFLAAYVGDAGHDYATIEAEGFPVLLVKGDEGPEVVENPRYRRR
jgi:glucose-6-phosphate isomerase, archaeal